MVGAVSGPFGEEAGNILGKKGWKIGISGVAISGSLIGVG